MKTGAVTPAERIVRTGGGMSPWRERPLIAFLATGFGSGLLRPWPGTWGSIPPVFLAWGLLRTGNDWLYAASTAALIALSIWVADRAEPLFGHDARPIVIDEWAGVFVGCLGLRPDWPTMMLVFVLFRVFDVLKPWPARRIEGLPGGWGVTADDIAAAVYTNIAVRIATSFLQS